MERSYAVDRAHADSQKHASKLGEVCDKEN